MARKRYSDEDVLKFLREIDVHLPEWFDDGRRDPRSGVVHRDWVRQ